MLARHMLYGFSDPTLMSKTLTREEET